MAYIKDEARQDGCFLCDTSAADDDAESLIVSRAPKTFVILNRFPYNTGHLMVAPYRHVGELDDLDREELEEVWAWTTKAVEALRKASQPQGFNIGINLGEAAGAGVPGHLHLHVVPRWGGDTNFMPVVGETKVLPEMLAETYAKLHPLLSSD
jgi:ATP adenylyltransferase